ncbi:PA0069 family radical SAM protein [Moheibacter lacus]|uniref:PA0069 family radical SAM protein n=1 Tax=Moheibacter lacus TaxID=2745851 RepID=A0A838ZPM8_9FLAO|nr:PA0069 family radical SAM protein [Moheibacter lacus]MBA5629457.1 PA0069 family radical SAM protein [Moheibacter lacus]
MISKATKGQGAIQNIQNHFERNQLVSTFYEDEIEESTVKTEFLEVFPKSILNVIKRKDMPIEYSINPYQGCEHGCAYCYARPTHEYWGYSAGVEFERKIMVKKTAPVLLEKLFQKKNYQPHSFMLSGNTDCYQPIERKLEITRKILKICLKYKHPVSIISKNALVLRDLDILKQLAEMNLVNVAISIPTINEDLRKKLEPRTSAITNKLSAIEILSQNQIPVIAMVAPIIPGLNSDEILQILKKVSALGAVDFGYTLVRLNDTVEPVFIHWLEAHFPDRKEKILNQIRSIHSGNLNERWAKKRYVGNGNYAEMIHQTFKIGRQKYFKDQPKREKLSTDLFVGSNADQLSLF